MSLTTDDLAAIKKIIDGSIDERVPAIIDDRVPAIIDERVPAIINELVPKIVQPMFDALAQDTAAGFAELHDKLDTVRLELKDDIAAVDYKVDQSFELLKKVEEKVERNAVQTRSNTTFVNQLKRALR